MAAPHTVTVTHVETTGRGGGIDLYRASCSCGWQTEQTMRREAAEHQRVLHALAALAEHNQTS